MKDWFTINQVDESTYIISEYQHWEATHCYLLIGSDRASLIDTGLGICNIYEQVRKLTDKPITAVATHIHWDHIGGHKYFSDFYVHGAELDWLDGGFPLPAQAVKNMVADRCELPGDFDINKYEIFQGEPSRVLDDGDTIDLGGRTIQALHTRDILRDTSVFGKQRKAISLPVTWYIKALCLPIILLLIRRAI